jgi:hypothetical protein
MKQTIRYYFALLLSLGLALGPVSTANAALETGTYISDLVSTNPAAGDAKSQGDDHIRLLKATVKATFPNVSGAVTPTHTELNYVDGVTSAIQTQINQATLTAGTVQATTSGTSIDFTSIPSWVKKITISFAGVSVSGTSNPIVQIGDSGGIEATGYLGASVALANGATVSVTNYTTGVGINSATAANVLHGSIVLSQVSASAFTWVASGNLSTSNSAALVTTSSSKSLSAALDRVRITTAGGTDTFDAGSINILYE